MYGTKITTDKFISNIPNNVKLNDVKTQGTANSLAFMVWSDKGGQDDIKSYVAVGNAGTYTAFMQLYNHKDVGTYTVHVYMGGKDGKLDCRSLSLIKKC